MTDRILTAAAADLVVDALSVAAHLLARLDGWTPGSPWTVHAARDRDPVREALADVLDAVLVLDPAYEDDVELVVDDVPELTAAVRLTALEWRVGALASDLGHHLRTMHAAELAELELEVER